VLGDEVNFSALEAKIAFQNPIAALLKVQGRNALSSRSQLPPWIG
jgi:hypothetical protein